MINDVFHDTETEHVVYFLPGRPGGPGGPGGPDTTETPLEPNCPKSEKP